jgi:hypothetical protein
VLGDASKGTPLGEASLDVGFVDIEHNAGSTAQNEIATAS